MNIVDEIEKENMKENIPKYDIGDLVDVHVKIVEGEKERVQIFNGTIISKKGGGIREVFTVRRIVQGEGVERVFPIHSPNVVDVVVKKSHKIRRAKLYYLRDRTGKQARLKEKFKPKKKVAKKTVEAKKAPKEQVTENKVATEEKVTAEKASETT